MNIRLSPEQIAALEAQHRQSGDRCVCDRIRCVLLSAQGWSAAMITQSQLIYESTVLRHIADYLVYWKQFSDDVAALRQHLGIHTLLSFLGQVSFPLTLYIGLQHTTALNAAIYISSMPCLVLLINYFLFRERISARNIIGVIASTAGVLYLNFSSSGGSGHVQTFGWGNILTIISALNGAFYCALLRLKKGVVKNTSFVTFSSLIGTVSLLTIFILHTTLAPDYLGVIYTVSPSVIAGIFYLIIFPSCLSYVSLNKGVSLIGTTRSEIYTYLIPVLGGIMGIVFLGNEHNAYLIIILLLIVLGIMCCSNRSSVT